MMERLKRTDGSKVTQLERNLSNVHVSSLSYGCAQLAAMAVSNSGPGGGFTAVALLICHI